MAQQANTEWPSRNSIKNAIEKENLMDDVDDDYDKEDIIDATINHLTVDRRTAGDILDAAWQNPEREIVVKEHGVVMCQNIPGTDDDDDLDDDISHIVNIIVESLYGDWVNSDLGYTWLTAIKGDWTDIWDGYWARSDHDGAIDRIETQKQFTVDITHNPNWVDRAIEMEKNTGFSWKQAKVIALLESDEYVEQRQISDLMDVSPAAISDIKRRIESKIEDVEYLQDTSDFF